MEEKRTTMEMDWEVGASLYKSKRSDHHETGLRLPNFNLPFEVHTNAFNRALEGVLVQEKHLIAYESRKLKDVEQRYNTHEKEMAAVIHCLEI